MAPNNPHKWADIQFSIAAIAMAAAIAFWNMFAGIDLKKEEQKQAEVPPPPTEAPAVLPITVSTVPPIGYTILFGGQAPQPQVIIVQSNHGGGGNSGNSGGGGGGHKPVTSTGSS